MPRLLALDALEREVALGLCGVLCDIDDTLTWEGQLGPDAFAALHALRDAGLKVIPVTGRPAGWCDHIARFWPVDGVVGENGGLWFWMEGGRLRRGYAQDSATRAANRRRLDEAATQILAAVPGAALASDQAYRELDLAIDFCEDVPALDRGAVDRIVAGFEQIGATCKVSSIHVNGWFGAFDKLEGFKRLTTALRLPEGPEAWAFVGDSANDGPMFAFFHTSVGVANVDGFLDRLPVWPRFRTEAPGGAGFAAFARRLLAIRAAG